MFDMSYSGGDMIARIENQLAKAAMIEKAGISTATGIVAYNLEPGALGLYFDECPLLAEVPRRIDHRGGTAVHWNSVTSVDQFNTAMGVAEGQRTGSITPTVVSNFATYKTLGKETNYTFEAEEAAESYDNVPEQSAAQLLSAFRIGESKVVGYGNTSFPLGTGPTPAAGTASTTSGTLPAATYVARIVPLTYDGVQQATVAGGVATTSTRNNNDGTSTTIPGGSGIAGAASAGVVLSANGSITWTWAPVQQALGYAVYVGTSAANAALAAIVTANSATISASPVGTQLAANITVDNSVNPLIYDGLFTQIANPASGSYYQSLNGATLTADGAGGISQFSTGFQYLWNNYKLGPDLLITSGTIKQQINQAILSSSGPVFRIDSNNGETGQTAGVDYTYILNPITGRKVRIMVDPWAPANFAMAVSTKLPYMVRNVPKPFELQTRMRDYYQIKWPVTTRTPYEGIYYSGVLKYYATFAAAVFSNIG